MSRRTTTLGYALLGVLSLGEKSGYEVRRLFIDTPMTQFSTSPGSIYPALQRLHDAGFLAARLEAGNRGSQRRIYRLTPAGEATLDDWLQESPSLTEIRSDVRTVLLRFSFMEHRLESEQVVRYLDHLESLLRDYRSELREYVDRFRRDGALHAELAMRHGVRAFSAHLEWVSEARDAITSGRKPECATKRRI